MDYTSVVEILGTCPLIGSLTTITSADLARFALAAESLVNAKLSKLYAVPVANAPVLTALATDLAIYRILSRRVFTQEQLNKSAWVDEYKSANELLDQIANGEVALITSSGTEVNQSASSEPWSNNLNYIPTMDQGMVENMVVDPDKLDDIYYGRQ